MARATLWMTTLRKQRFILGGLLLALAWPTYAAYDFRGTWIMATLCIAGGIVGVGMAVLHDGSDDSDERDVFLGGIVALTFLARLVIFLIEDLSDVDDLLSTEALHELYDGGSAPIIHLMLIYVGLVIAARPIRRRTDRTVDGSP